MGYKPNYHNLGSVGPTGLIFNHLLDKDNHSMYVESIMLHEQNYREVDEMSCRFENKKTHIEAWRKRFYNNRTLERYKIILCLASVEQ